MLRSDNAKILVTGFEPFGKNTVNPSMEVLAVTGSTKLYESINS